MVSAKIPTEKHALISSCAGNKIELSTYSVGPCLLLKFEPVALKSP